MGSDSKKNNFIMQAGILAAAGIISRIIGLLYRSPLHRVIGDLGLGYYQSAYNYYTIILLISSYSIPAAISKVIAQKLAVKEYRNAHRLFKCALAYVLVVGGSAGAAGICTDHFCLRYTRCPERIFSGAQKYGADFGFPDTGADCQCGCQCGGGLSFDS